MLFDEPNQPWTPPPSPQPYFTSRSPSFSPPSLFPSRESSMEPNSEDSSPQGRRRHSSEPNLIRPCDIDRGLISGLSGQMEVTSPLAPYNLKRTAKTQRQTSVYHHALISFKTIWNLIQNWLLSRPSKFSMGNTLQLTPFKTITLNYTGIHISTGNNHQVFKSSFLSRLSCIQWIFGIFGPWIIMQHISSKVNPFKTIQKRETQEWRQ